MGGKSVSFLFIWVCSAIAAVVVLLKLVFPYLFKLALGKPSLMTTPSTLFTWFMIMAVMAGLLYATSSNVRLKDFLSFLYQGTESNVRNGLFFAVLVAFPLIIGYITYGTVAPGSTSPVELRIQHPTLPGEYENLENPFRKGDAETQKQALIEGIDLYQKNCSPCHGCAADAKGSMARGFRLKPINFTDPGTIGTVVESYVFWRIREGYASLPPTSSPWDSSMPVWKNDLSDEECWKIAMATYELAGIVPRQPEAHKASETHKEERPTTALPTETDGKSLYNKYCFSCHGIDGDGNGIAADYLYPRPRDFTKCIYKFRTTPAGDLPLDEDILGSITHGMPGTSMPAWESRLSENERLSLVSYLKNFCEDFSSVKKGDLVGVEVQSPSQQDISNFQQRGKEIYTKMKCNECHGEQGRADGPASGTHTDDWGYTIFPANLTDGWNYRKGNTPRDIYITLTAGLSGTPMPSYADTMSTQERWILAHYVSDLSIDKADYGTIVKSTFTDAALPNKPDDPMWEAIPSVAIPLAGQVIVKPRWQNPSVYTIFVKSVYNATEVAFLLEWDDKTKNISHQEPDAGDDTGDSYAKVDADKNRALKLRDSVAIKLPVKSAGGPEKPHLLMGDPLRPINMLQWNSDWQEDTGRTSPVEELNAKGSGKPPVAQDNASQTATGSGIWSDGRWKVVVKRSLVTNDKNDVQLTKGKLIPIAFSVWDGSNGEVGLRMSISSWYYLLLSVPANIMVYIYGVGAIGAAVAFEWWFIKKVSSVK